MPPHHQDPALPPDLQDGIPDGPAGLGPVIAAVVLALGAYIALSIALAPDSMIQFNFKSERGSITLLSSGMFLAAACTAAAARRATPAEDGRSRLLWTTFTVLLGYFWLDEVLQFHEKTGDLLDGHLPRGPFRTYNDVVVLLYVLPLIPVALLTWRAVLRHRRLMPMLVVTGLLYAATSSVDSLVENATPLSVIVEESIKVTCSSFFVLSMLTGLLAVRALHGREAEEAAGPPAPADGTRPPGDAAPPPELLFGGPTVRPLADPADAAPQGTAFDAFRADPYVVR